MSGAGGGLILGAIAIALIGPVIVAAGAAILAGGALYIASKAAIGAGRGIYHIHKINEEKRLMKARAELETVTGELKEVALRRHDALKAAEKSLAEEYEKAVDEREKRLEEAHSRLEKAEGKMDDLILELPQYFEARQKDVEVAIDREIKAFSSNLDEVCTGIMKDATKSMEAKTADALSKLDAAEGTMDAKRSQYLSYAMEQMTSSKSMIEALERGYNCKKYASAELEAAKSALNQLESLMAKTDGASARAAAMSSAMLAERVLTLQVRAEQRTAKDMNLQAMLKARLEELKVITEATHDLKKDDKKGILDAFVDEEKDADFWSEGRLGKLWEKTARLEEKVKNLQYSEAMDDEAAILAAEIDMQMVALEKEHARVRSFLLSKVALAKTLGDILESEQEAGWELVEEPYYHLNEQKEEDERLPVELVLERDGDRKTIVLYDEYDEKTQQYRQGVRRLMNEAGEANEQKRQEEDELMSERMRKRGHKDFKMSCDKRTVGQKLTGQD